jgi:hypothetical protein
MATINANRMDWKAKKTVMEEIMQRGGTLFGGAVRDWYIHDHYATKFYDAVGSAGAADATERYGDADFLPEFKDRLVVPNDIDASIPEANIAGLIDALKNAGFAVSCKFRRDAKRYLTNLQVEENEVMHHRYEIRYVNKYLSQQMRRAFPAAMLEEPAFAAILAEATTRAEELFNTVYRKCAFDMDILATKPGFTMEPPFGNLDFACNGLLMTRDGMRLSKMLTQVHARNPMAYNRLYEKTLSDILKRRANIVVPGSDVPTYRLEKMLKHGWVIGNFTMVKYIQDDTAYDGYCIICHEDLPSSHYKMNCCDARFHTKCLVDAMRRGNACMSYTGQCIMCKTQQAPAFYSMDATILSSIVAVRRFLAEDEAQAADTSAAAITNF